MTTNESMRKYRISISSMHEAPTSNDAVHSVYLALQEAFRHNQKLPFTVEEIDSEDGSPLKEYHVNYHPKSGGILP